MTNILAKHFNVLLNVILHTDCEINIFNKSLNIPKFDVEYSKMNKFKYLSMITVITEYWIQSSHRKCIQ